MGQDAATILGAYDEHLRGPVELAGATDVATDGPLYRGRFSDTGFVTHRPLAPGADLPALVARTIAHFAATDVVEFEWKTRGHDLPGLAPLLRAHGLVPGPEETLMVGPVDLALGESAGPVTVRRAGVPGPTASGCCTATACRPPGRSWSGRASSRWAPPRRGCGVGSMARCVSPLASPSST